MRLALTMGLGLLLTQAAWGAPSQGNQNVSVPAASPSVPAIAPVQPENPLQPALTPPPAVSVQATVLSASDISLYRQLFTAERSVQISKTKNLLARISDPSLEGYAEAARLESDPHVAIGELMAWLEKYRELSVADRIYRLAVDHSTKKVRRHHKTIRVAVVTNIPAPTAVPRRTGGYEDQELPEPSPSGSAARSVLGPILADIKEGQPQAAQAKLDSVRASASAEDVAILSHRVAASYLAEGMDGPAFALASAVANTNAAPQLDWDAGFSAYRLGRFTEAATHLEKLAQNGGVQGKLRAQAAFWAARAHMQAGEPQRVVSLLAAAAKEEPSFYGLLAERVLGMDTLTGFSEPVLNHADFTHLMTVPAAHRAVALWQVGETEHVGNELNRAFVYDDASLDPAMAALARDLGVTNIELRASEASVARGLLLTGLFPVPSYEPQGGYRIDKSLVLAFARLESRFQNGSTSVAGAHGIMQLMPKTAELIAGKGASEQLDDPSYSMSLGQRYISQLLDRLNGNLLELGGAYNAGPGAAARWMTTKAGKDDPLLFIESIPVAETRGYVRRLMEYQWMYRRRFGEDAKSLDETARGQWPLYHPAISPAPVAQAPAPSQADTGPLQNVSTF
ncbi:MAG TPA: lytic transglycosylase domain-containing protein [Rhizomicrobium sp.]|jgi:soluble lytic murein transglycosylase-like protein|nr:lytic transglycosylase domain-containing protein [Rhizomicrobium sp.]